MSALSPYLHVFGIIGWPELLGILMVIGIVGVPIAILVIALNSERKRAEKRKLQPPPMPPEN